MTTIVVLIVSGALIIGALWGLYGNLSKRLEGFLVALAGGALLVSALLELIYPALEKNSVPIALTTVFVGAITFTVLDYWVKENGTHKVAAAYLLPLLWTAFLKTWHWAFH